MPIAVLMTRAAAAMTSAAPLAVAKDVRWVADMHPGSSPGNWRGATKAANANNSPTGEENSPYDDRGLERDECGRTRSSRSCSLFYREIQTSGDSASGHHALSSEDVGLAKQPLLETGDIRPMVGALRTNQPISRLSGDRLRRER